MRCKMRRIFIPENHKELRSLVGKLVNVNGNITGRFCNTIIVYNGTRTDIREMYEFTDVNLFLIAKESIFIERISTDEIKFGLNGVIFPDNIQDRIKNMRRLEYNRNTEGYSNLKYLIENL